MEGINVTRLFYLIVGVIIFWSGITSSSGQSRVRGTAFRNLPDQSEDPYYQRLKTKTLPVNNTDFVVLAKKTSSSYTVEFYTADLKKLWEAPLNLTANEDIEAFAQNGSQVLVLTHKQNQEAGIQNLLGYTIDLKTGKKSEVKNIAEAPAKSRRLGAAFSEDGTKVVAYAYLHQQDRLKAINALILDGNLNKIKERTYTFDDLQGIQSATVKIDNAGNQYVSLITHNATKLSVRRYTNNSQTLKGMDIQIGGVFEGKKVYIFDTQFSLQQDSSVYAAAMCADEKTGDLYSLKVINFDFRSGDMKYAPEFRFTPQYLADLNKLNKTTTKPVTRLEDIYLSEVVVSPEKKVLVIAEKKYNEGPRLPFAARELHLFSYDEFMNPTWHSLINKNQVAPATEGFAAISYKAYLAGSDLHLLTLETLNNKTDLYHRKINIAKGTTAAPKPLGLNLAATQGLPYQKDFTAWLNEKTIIAVTKPAKKASTLQLNRILVK